MEFKTMFNSIFDIEFNPHKYLAHWERVNALARGEDCAPVTLELDVCSACNHNCKWCVDPEGSHSNRVMPLETVKRILSEAREIGVKGVVFKGGGESTLHPQLAEILQMASAAGFETGLVTHGGNLLSPGLVESIVENCAYVRVSIDGPTPESRQRIHGTNDFAALLEGVEKLIARRGSRRHPITGATFCLQYHMRDLIPAAIQLGESLQLDYVLVRPPFCEETGFPAPHTPEEAEALRKEIARAAGEYKGNMAVMAGNWIGDAEMKHQTTASAVQDMARRDIAVHPQPYNGIEHRTQRCLASPLFIVVTAEGDLYGCCCLRGIKEFSFGRLDYDRNITIQSLINGEKRKQNLERMRRVECLKYCTHPLNRVNQLIEYLALPEKHHASFI